MAQASQITRMYAATQAEAVIDGHIDYRTFLDSLPRDAEGDDLIEELVDLIEHEPKVGGFLGVRAQQHTEYMARAREIIASLKGA